MKAKQFLENYVCESLNKVSTQKIEKQLMMIIDALAETSIMETTVSTIERMFNYDSDSDDGNFSYKVNDILEVQMIKSFNQAAKEIVAEAKKLK